FKQSRNVRIFCGEFGVYIPNSNNEDRVFWYDTVRKYLEEKGIAWTSWDYHGGFGLYNENGNDLFDHDLNVPLLQALGMNAPPQTEFILKPDSIGFSIYTDYIESKIFESSYSSGTLDFYSQTQPNNGEHCLYWSGAEQYNVIGFDFKPNKDLSYLLNNNYALDFWIRGDSPEKTFDIRFVDSKNNDPNDHPWRIGVTIDESLAKWDNQWHHVRIPLKNFTEQGSWDNNNWYNPQGKFDWKAVDRLEIVSEQGALQNVKFWFDQIQILNDVTTFIVNIDNEINIKIYPNPTKDYLQIESKSLDQMTYQLIDAYGRMMQANIFRAQTQVNLLGLPGGLYFLNVKNEGKLFKTYKIWKQ
ncbi:MAG: T9SS type A sorting domain-containing protein, partial [Saprospiraceae bacterium]|nr:T9SS type A sorting domain-containing protein [Saprospiraceae bacterium]